MAERRMFAKAIVLSDAFLDMPLSARCLYFTLGMLADDDGFVGSPKAIMRQCGASQDDMMVLLQKRYILAFESGVIVIKHWRMNNYLQNDRHKDTTYIEEMKTLKIDDKGAYTEKDKSMYTECIQNVYTDKNSIDKNSIGKVSIDTPTPSEWEEDKHTNIENFDHLIETEMKEGMNPDLIQSIKDWLIYKDHKKPKRDNHYQLESIRKLANRTFKEAQAYGVETVIGVIDSSIMNNYQGIIWDSLEKNSKKNKVDVMKL